MPLSPTLMLSVVIALLVGFMIATNLNQKKNNDQDEIYTKQAELAERTATLNAERARLGLPPREEFGADSPDQIAARLIKDASILANYADRIHKQRQEKDQTIAEKNKILQESEQTRQVLSSQLGRVQTHLDKALADGASSVSLRAELNEARNSLAPLQERLAEFAGRPTNEQMDLATARIAELEAQIATMQSKPIPAPPASPAPSKLFAESATDLFPMAQGLFQGLNELEDKADLEISAAYNRFATQHRASFLKEIRFPTGSSQLNPADKIALGDALANLPDGSMILVVGYASTTGNADSNRQLSSVHATIVAGNINIAKPGKQIVQAVFLGQTKRFSSRIPEENQVCEVWQINAK